MIVVVSDLHLNDGSAAADNIPPEACGLWFEHIIELAQRNGARELDFVYLGDVFDLIRTEHWFYPAPHEPLPSWEPEPEPGRLDAAREAYVATVRGGNLASDPFPTDARPWSNPESRSVVVPLELRCKERAFQILKRIGEVCDEQLAFLAGRSSAVARLARLLLSGRGQGLAHRQGDELRDLERAHAEARARARQRPSTAR